IEEAEGSSFLTMELVTGKTLAEMIAAGPLPLDRFFEVAIPLADALAAAHERGIVHRDLKPANVMVDAENRVKVLDFGLAKCWERDESPELQATRTQEGTFRGTPAYMSPGQARGRA